MLIKDHESAYADYIGMAWYDKHQVIEYPAGFRERLQGRSVEAQMNLFALVENTEISRSSWGGTQRQKGPMRLTDCSAFRGLIVEDGIIEGVLIETVWRVTPMGPNDTVLTYYADDNNGSGSTSREDTVTLICLPPDEEWT